MGILIFNDRDSKILVIINVLKIKKRESRRHYNEKYNLETIWFNTTGIDHGFFYNSRYWSYSESTAKGK